MHLRPQPSLMSYYQGTVVVFFIGVATAKLSMYLILCAHILNPEASTLKISGGGGEKQRKAKKGKLMKRKGSTEAEGRVVKE